MGKENRTVIQDQVVRKLCAHLHMDEERLFMFLLIEADRPGIDYLPRRVQERIMKLAIRVSGEELVTVLPEETQNERLDRLIKNDVEHSYRDREDQDGSTDWGIVEAEDPRPCKGSNTNVCVAEGCYGEACINGPSSRT